MSAWIFLYYFYSLSLCLFQEWTDNIATTMTRALVSIQTRSKVKSYVLVVRGRGITCLTEDITDGVKETLYAVFPNTKIKPGNKNITMLVIMHRYMYTI